jgi:hypothetical protein
MINRAHDCKTRAIPCRWAGYRHSGIRSTFETIDVAHRPLPSIIDPRAAVAISDRRVRHDDPETAFAMAQHHISITTEYPRNGGTPIECFVEVRREGAPLLSAPRNIEKRRIAIPPIQTRISEALVNPITDGQTGKRQISVTRTTLPANCMFRFLDPGVRSRLPVRFRRPRR